MASTDAGCIAQLQGWMPFFVLRSSAAGLPVEIRGDVASGSWLVFNGPDANVTMLTRCPNCKSSDVRRSSVRAPEAAGKPWLRWPYRCRSCNKRFWATSIPARYLWWLIGLAVVAGAAWKIAGEPEAAGTAPKPPAMFVDRLAEAVKLAETNDPAAEYRLARMYATASGVEGNRKQALIWLERAAQHGSAEAQFELGNALRDGNGVVQDYERAAKWLQMAAEQGSADAQYALGQMYRMGMGVPSDNARAYMWFNLAAAQEFAGAAAQRDAVLHRLTAAEIVEAQAEARRLTDAASKQLPLAR
jgi:hypothetical protein